TTVRDVFDQLVTERNIAYTTVMSTMDNLHTKGWLTRERDGKAYQYWATLSREEHSAQLMREALEGGGQPDLVLNHFVEQISPEKSARLRAALRRLSRRAEHR
ncbi:MAG: BlaI/MecI/CopY family transcriptional regulator, partial [Actinomycetia bacterium]|nr:BlaI/MecI/CopY family transcriptional regulator [Actinomycetes bacterium]